MSLFAVTFSTYLCLITHFRKDAENSKTIISTKVPVNSASPREANTDGPSSAAESNESGDGPSSAQVKANNEAAKHLSRLQDKLRLTEQDRSKLQKVMLLA